MVGTIGLTGLRPSPEHAERVTSPPYDVIKPGSKLEQRLQGEPASLYHVILGDEPAAALGRLREQGHLVEDDEPCFYVYEQNTSDKTRTGVFVAPEVHPYDKGEIIRHEKTFDEKVKGRIALREGTGYTFGPVFALTRASIGGLLEQAKTDTPLYEFSSDFGGLNDLHGIRNRIWRVPEASELGRKIQAAIGQQPLYIADGHHRYHAALKYGQTHFLCYVAEEAGIQAYNRVINGVRKFSEIQGDLPLKPTDRFETPPKHHFNIYTGEKCYQLPAQHVPDDVVGRLDCAILERELYPKLGLTHDMIKDPKHFDYYPEWALDDMKAVVDRGDYDIAVALHPVSLEELMAVADAGLEDPEVVMPEKSTFFAPKILTGVFIYRHQFA
jgi:uncharacterized protein (DUF1015 family)